MGNIASIPKFHLKADMKLRMFKRGYFQIKSKTDKDFGRNRHVIDGAELWPEDNSLIAVNIELPFRINDWVKIGDLEEGKVIDITWRTTRIQTRENFILSIPNSIVSESPVLNYCYPDDNYMISFMVDVDSSHSFEYVQKIILNAIHSSEGILKKPSPVVTFEGFSDSSATYLVEFNVDDYSTKPLYTSNIWKEIYKHFKLAGMTANNPA